jgi:hypothetical protein
MAGNNDFCGPIIPAVGDGMSVASRLLPELRAERPRRP